MDIQLLALINPCVEQDGAIAHTVWQRGDKSGVLRIAYLPEGDQWRRDLLNDRILNLEEHFSQKIFEDGGWIPLEIKDDTQGDCFFQDPEGSQIVNTSTWFTKQSENNIAHETILYRIGAFNEETNTCWGAAQFRMVMDYPETRDARQQIKSPKLALHLDGLYVHQYQRSRGVAAGMIDCIKDIVVHHLRMSSGFSKMLSSETGGNMTPTLSIATPADSSVRKRVLKSLSGIALPPNLNHVAIDNTPSI